MKLFWGSPAHPGELRFHTATLLSKGGEPTEVQHFNRHEISALYGMQVCNMFIGVIKVGRWGFSNVGRSTRPGGRT